MASANPSRLAGPYLANALIPLYEWPTIHPERGGYIPNRYCDSARYGRSTGLAVLPTPSLIRGLSKSAAASQASLVIILCEDISWAPRLVAVLANHLVSRVADWTIEEVRRRSLWAKNGQLVIEVRIMAGFVNAGGA